MTGLLCWRDFHPLEWQLASLHWSGRALQEVFLLKGFWTRARACVPPGSFRFAGSDLMYVLLRDDELIFTPTPSMIVHFACRDICGCGVTQWQS